jgi:hypothetical protein
MSSPSAGLALPPASTFAYRIRVLGWEGEGGWVAQTLPVFMQTWGLNRDCRLYAELEFV